MNLVVMDGRLTRDPQVSYSQGEKPIAIARYGLAVDRKYKREGQPTVDFFNCAVFGKGAEFAEKYLKKGTKILVTGRLQTGSYTNREGHKVNTTDIVVEDQEFMTSKAENQAEKPVEEPKTEWTDAADMELPFV